jgi:hypothetical protein
MTMHDSRIITALAACGIATALASGTAAGESVAHQRFESLIAEGVIEAPAGDTAMPDEPMTREQARRMALRLLSMEGVQAQEWSYNNQSWKPPETVFDVRTYSSAFSPRPDESELVPITINEAFLPDLSSDYLDSSPMPEQAKEFFRRNLGSTHESSSSVIMVRKSIAAVITSIQETIADIQSNWLTSPTRYTDPADTSIYDRYVYRYANAEALEDAVETAAEASVDVPDSPWADFPFYADGLISPAVPEELPGGAISAIYHGRLAGAFDNGTAVGADITLDVYFDQQIFGGSIAFKGGELPVNGQWRGPDQISGYFEGSALGGEVTGNLNGAFYGANVEEVGGNWALEVTAGPTGGRTASGEFAARR